MAPQLPVAARVARACWVFGFVAAGLAITGTLVMETALEIAILRTGAWLALGFGVLGLVTGLLSRGHPAGRTAVVASVLLLAVVGAFLVYSAPLIVADATVGG